MPQEEPLTIDPTIKNFIFSPRYQQSVESVRSQFQLKNEDVLFVGDLDRLVFAKQLDLDAYLLALDDEFAERFTDDERNRLFAMLLAERFVPLGGFLQPTAKDVAQTESLTLPATGYYQVYMNPLSYTVCVNEIGLAAGLSLETGERRGLLRELLVGNINGSRSDAQIRETLMRGEPYGGLGLNGAQADAVMAAMKDILSRAKILSEDDAAKWTADDVQKKQDPDEREIEQVKQAMPEPIRGPMTELDKDIETTIARLSYKPEDDYLQKRLRYVISSRLRDVRSGLELRQLLARDSKVGGLGLAAADAEKVAMEIEQAYAEFHERIASDEMHKIEAQLHEQKRKIEERRKREAEEHARWFEEKIRARKAGDVQTAQVKSELQRLIVGPTTQINVPVQVVAAPVAKPGVNVSPATAAMVEQQAVMTRPSLDTVSHPSPQLMSLVGELQKMSIAEFRRVSSNSEEAVRKIYEDIQTLAGESFEKKLAGMKAFRESPLYGDYVKLVGESLAKGQPVATLADEKRKAGANSLSSHEITAIMALNRKLQF